MGMCGTIVPRQTAQMCVRVFRAGSDMLMYLHIGYQIRLWGRREKVFLQETKVHLHVSLLLERD